MEVDEDYGKAFDIEAERVVDKSSIEILQFVVGKVVGSVFRLPGSEPSSSRVSEREIGGGGWSRRLSRYRLPLSIRSTTHEGWG